MTKYSIDVVETKGGIREFHDLPKRIYRDYPAWVSPLRGDVESRFDPKKNELLGNGEAIRWVVRNSAGDVVGRIAAFYNRDLAYANDQPTGGCGFFESIDNQDIANLLLDSAKAWLEERGMEAMDGPVNFGERDDWWGLLVEGYEHQPLYCCNYNPPYYKHLFENYGFKLYFNQITYLRRLVSGELNPSIYRRVERLEQDPGYRFAHIKKSEVKSAADDFCDIYNKAWASFTGVKPMTREKAHSIMQKLRPIMDERLMYFAYYNNKPIGFFLMMPDLNTIIGRFNGGLNLINTLRMLFIVNYTKKVDRAKALIFGIIPEFQGKGVEAGMIRNVERCIEEGVIRYKTMEISWIGDFNPIMMRMVEKYVCAEQHKVHTTYRYLFDREKEFNRMPAMQIMRRS